MCRYQSGAPCDCDFPCTLQLSGVLHVPGRIKAGCLLSSKRSVFCTFDQRLSRKRGLYTNESAQGLSWGLELPDNPGVPHVSLVGGIFMQVSASLDPGNAQGCQYLNLLVKIQVPLGLLRAQFLPRTSCLFQTRIFFRSWNFFMPTWTDCQVFMGSGTDTRSSLRGMLPPLVRPAPEPSPVHVLSITQNLFLPFRASCPGIFQGDPGVQRIQSE